MMHVVLLLCVCVLVSSLPNGQHSLHDTYSHSQTLTLKIQRDLQKLLPQYEKQLGIQDLQVFNLYMKSLPTCASNYTEWLSLKDAVRLQHNSWVLQVFGLHIEACCSSELPQDPDAQSQLRNVLELLQFDVRDLRAQISQQLKSLQSPTVSRVVLPSVPTPRCSPQSKWYGHVQGYIVLRGLERCLHKVVRDYTLLRSQQQQ